MWVGLAIECERSDILGLLQLDHKKLCSFLIRSFGMLALGEASPHVKSLNPLRLPCCEEAQGSHGMEKEIDGSMANSGGILGNLFFGRKHPGLWCLLIPGYN